MYKKQLRYFCFAFLMLFVLSLVAGCASTPASTPAPTNPPASAAAATTAPAAAAATAVQATTAPAAGSTTAASGKKYVIGVSSFQLGNDWNIQVADGAQSKITEKGWQEVHTNAEGDSNAQITALEGFLSQKVDGVVVAGGSGPALVPAIQKLVAANIPVVCIDITVPDAVTNIYPDTYMTTELLSQFVVNKLQAKPGVYVHVTIPGMGWKTVDIRDNVADLVFKTEGWTSVGVVNSGLADAITQTATGIRSTLLAHPELNVVYSSWGNPAIGAANAIREAGLQSKVWVVNTDADRDVLAEMDKADSPIVAVIGQEPTLEGQMAIDALAKAFAGDTNIPKITYAPFVFVTKEPDLLPPGVQNVLDPEKAWALIYPNVPFGQLK